MTAAVTGMANVAVSRVVSLHDTIRDLVAVDLTARCTCEANQ
jgi:hypothetical protein